MLNALSVDELKSVKREFCPKITPYSQQDGKNAFVGSIRDSLKRSFDKKEISYHEFMHFLRQELSDDTPKQITTKIRNVLEEIQISKNAGYKTTRSVRERWICSEIYQALRYELKDTDYKVEVEKSLKGNYRADLFLSHRSGKKNYLIEVKFAGKSGSRDRLPHQVTKYQDCISYLKRTFVLLIVQYKKYLPENNDAVAKVIEDVESRKRTEVIVKGPGKLEYRSG